MELESNFKMFSFIALANIITTVTYKYSCSYIKEHSFMNEH